jgi:hypothetical protein
VILPRPARLAALAAAAALVGCPIPQPLPGYPATGLITPPRFLVSSVLPPDPVVEVGSACAADPIFHLSATLVDENTTEAIAYRWFLDCTATANGCIPVLTSQIPPPLANAPTVLRDVDPYAFDAYGGLGHADGAVHVVELVVSNGFLTNTPDTTVDPLAWRKPALNYETQLYRWVFHYSAAGACP